MWPIQADFGKKLIMAFFDKDSDASIFIISWAENPIGHFGVFAKGYTLAANRLSALLLDAQRFSDHEAYPVVFLYRHALELSLNQIIYKCALLAKFRFVDRVNADLKNTHNLGRLFESVEGPLSLLFPDDDSLSDVIRDVRVVCTELNDLDPRSDGYRYPIDSKGRPSTGRHQVINLRAFSRRMSSVLDDLGTVQFGMDVETDRAQDAYEAVERLLSSIWVDSADDTD